MVMNNRCWCVCLPTILIYLKLLALDRRIVIYWFSFIIILNVCYKHRGPSYNFSLSRPVLEPLVTVTQNIKFFEVKLLLWWNIFLRWKFFLRWKTFFEMKIFFEVKIFFEMENFFWDENFFWGEKTFLS